MGRAGIERKHARKKPGSPLRDVDARNQLPAQQLARARLAPRSGRCSRSWSDRGMTCPSSRWAAGVRPKSSSSVSTSPWYPMAEICDSVIDRTERLAHLAKALVQDPNCHICMYSMIRIFPEDPYWQASLQGICARRAEKGKSRQRGARHRAQRSRAGCSEYRHAKKKGGNCQISGDSFFGVSKQVFCKS